MYSIFFAHANNTIGGNILGGKTLRYIADAVDNGVIDTHLQRWNRDVRDGVITYNNSIAWVTPPVGLNEQSGVMTVSGNTFNYNDRTNNFFFSSRRRHTRCLSDWSSDVCSSDLCFSPTLRVSAAPKASAPHNAPWLTGQSTLKTHKFAGTFGVFFKTS